MAGIGQVFNNIYERLDGFVEDFADEFLERVKRRTPVRTGKLRRGWDMQMDGDALIISNDVEYAEYVEYGTDKMQGRFMLTTTVAEAQQIADRTIGYY